MFQINDSCSELLLSCPTKTTHLVAVASGRAGRVFARPLFRKLNVHEGTLFNVIMTLRGEGVRASLVLRPPPAAIVVCSTNSNASDDSCGVGLGTRLG